MRARRLDDRREIGGFLRQDPWLRIYELGDLDSANFSYTRWWKIGDPIEALCLLWMASDPPTLLCFRRHDADRAPEELLGAIDTELPRPLYAHLSPGLERALGGRREQRGLHAKLGLKQPEKLQSVDCGVTELLDETHLTEMRSLYDRSYPGSWFDPRMVSTGLYFGARDAGVLVAIAGVHVVSEEQRVAALGNIVTDVAERGRGHATRVTARLCRALLERVDHVGLNVKADNRPALACYQKLGFCPVASYAELVFS